ncbi:hypothetical protein RHECNPAF_3500045 [Rhizobium etli CNPAF512]|nr:hypothetical protein RHECNPAF_3500045 [Rhizobium etli CNPAF512]
MALQFLPQRVCLNSTGPGLSSLIKRATRRSKGARTRRALNDETMSNARFRTRSAHGACGASLWITGVWIFRLGCWRRLGRKDSVEMVLFSSVMLKDRTLLSSRGAAAIGDQWFTLSPGLHSGVGNPTKTEKCDNCVMVSREISHRNKSFALALS